MKNKKIILLIVCLILTGCGEKKYTVTFNTDGGEKMSSISIKEGEKIETLTPPSKEGYLFVNWEKDGLEYKLDTPITEDITLTANWIEAPVIKNDYTITYVTEKYTEKIMVEANGILKEPSAPQKENYLFLGWYIGDEKYDFSNKVTKDMVLTAKYKLNTVTITYDLYEGTVLTKKSIISGTTIEIPDTPTKEGYRFLKWTVDDKEFSFDTKITKDITLKALWEKKEYITVKFDTNGGTVYEDIVLEKYSRIDNLPTPTKEGYIFKEWQLNGKSFNQDTIIIDNIRIKAIYDNISEQ